MAQYGRPTADISVGSWGATPLNAKLSETSPDDATTQIQSSNRPTNDTFEVRLTSVTDPLTNTSHVVRIRMYGTSGHTWSAYLYQGSTIIKTLESGASVPTSYTTYSYTLTSGEADSITNYADLRVRIVANGSASGRDYVTWIEMEFPDVIIQKSGSATISGGGSTLATIKKGALVATAIALLIPLFVADTVNNRYHRRNKNDLSFVSVYGSGGSGDNEFSSPTGIAVDATHIYIADYSNHRIVKRLRADDSFVAKIGSQGSGNDQFDSPQGIAIDDEFIYVADTQNNRIQKRKKSDLSYVSKIGSAGTGNDQFQEPRGIAVDDTYVYVADLSNNRIVQRLKTTLAYNSKIGSYGTGNDQFNLPAGVGVNATHLFVADGGNGRIHKRTKALAYVSIIGSTGGGNDQFNNPQGISADDTHVYVADTNNNRLMKRLASDLSYVSKIGSSGSGNDQFSYPYGVAVVADEFVTVTGDKTFTAFIHGGWDETETITDNFQRADPGPNWIAISEPGGYCTILDQAGDKVLTVEGATGHRFPAYAPFGKVLYGKVETYASSPPTSIVGPALRIQKNEQGQLRAYFVRVSASNDLQVALLETYGLSYLYTGALTNTFLQHDYLSAEYTKANQIVVRHRRTGSFDVLEATVEVSVPNRLPAGYLGSYIDSAGTTIARPDADVLAKKNAPASAVISGGGSVSIVARKDAFAQSVISGSGNIYVTSEDHYGDAAISGNGTVAASTQKDARSSLIIVQDNFNRADVALLQSPWATHVGWDNGTYGLGIKNNAAHHHSGQPTHNTVYRTDALVHRDVKASLKFLIDAGHPSSPVIRFFFRTDTATNRAIRVAFSGSYVSFTEYRPEDTYLGQVGIGAYQTNDVYEINLVGASVTIRRFRSGSWSQVYSGSPLTILSPGRVGIGTYFTGDQDVTFVDDFLVTTVTFGISGNGTVAAVGSVGVEEIVAVHGGGFVAATSQKTMLVAVSISGGGTVYASASENAWRAVVISGNGTVTMAGKKGGKSSVIGVSETVDDFNRQDGDVGANYSTMGSTVNYIAQIQSNALTTNVATNQSYSRRIGTFAEETSAKVTLGSLWDAQFYTIALIVRGNETGAKQGYNLMTTLGSTVSIVRFHNGAGVQIGSVDVGAVPAPGDTLKIVPSGSGPVTLAVYRNDVYRGQVIDNTGPYKTGGGPGLWLFGDWGLTVDDFAWAVTTTVSGLRISGGGTVAVAISPGRQYHPWLWGGGNAYATGDSTFVDTGSAAVIIHGGGEVNATGNIMTYTAADVFGGGRLVAEYDRAYPYLPQGVLPNEDSIVSLVSIEMDYCSRTFGVSPCLATGTPCFNTWKTCRYIQAYSVVPKVYRYVSAAYPQALPLTRPYVEDVKLLPTEIKTNLTVNSRLTFTMLDEPDADVDTDPYWSQRSSHPGTYWKRWVARNPNYKGRVVRVYEGVYGRAESMYVERWSGKLENIQINGEKVSFEAVDVLKDLSKIEVPKKTNAKLMLDLTAVERTSFTITEDAASFPSAGYVRIDDEIIQYGTLNTTTKTFGTLTRGLFGTVAAAHGKSTKVQMVRYYPPKNPFDHLLDILFVDAEMSGAAWIPETGSGAAVQQLQVTQFPYFSNLSNYVNLQSSLYPQLLPQTGWLRLYDGATGLEEIMAYSSHVFFPAVGSGDTSEKVVNGNFEQGLSQTVWIGYKSDDYGMPPFTWDFSLLQDSYYQGGWKYDWSCIPYEIGFDPLGGIFLLQNLTNKLAAGRTYTIKFTSGVRPGSGRTMGTDLGFDLWVGSGVWSKGQPFTSNLLRLRTAGPGTWQATFTANGPSATIFVGCWRTQVQQMPGSVTMQECCVDEFSVVENTYPAHERFYISQRVVAGTRLSSSRQDVYGVTQGASGVDVAAFNYYKTWPTTDLNFEAVVTEPTKLSTLYFEILELVDCKSWVAENLKITVRRNVASPPGVTLHTLSDADNIILDSGQTDLNEKSRITRLSLWWDKLAIAKMDDYYGYRRLDIGVDPDAETNYGDPIEKTLFCRWINPLAHVEETVAAYVKNIATKRVKRERDAQNLITVKVAVKDAKVITGDHVRLFSDELTDIYGNPISAKVYQVVKRESRSARDGTITLTLLQISAVRSAVIGPAGLPDYGAASEAQREFAYIADANGFMSDGSDGYYIW